MHRINLKLAGFFIFSLFLLPISAAPTVYGKLGVTIESQDLKEGSKLDLVSNASRLGVKGNIDLGEGLEVIYQAEYEIDPVDGKADESKKRTFKQRNSFIGIKGDYGTLFLGTHDTALKKSQAKIDLFNDLVGDIENILQGENRMSDFVGYTTPMIGKGFSATFNTIKRTSNLDKDGRGDSKSYSFNYKTKSFYAGIAIDSDVKGYDSTRFSVQIPLNKNQIGIIYQDSKKLSTCSEENGFVTSFSRKITEKGIIKIQIAESDMKISSGKQLSFGYDYKFNKNTKFFFFYTDLSEDQDLKEKEISALGFEYKF